MQADGYLKSVTPVEELDVFLSIRGMCQVEVGRYDDAAESFSRASQLVPSCRSYGRLQADVRSSAGNHKRMR